jgi:hypothetical protein
MKERLLVLAKAAPQLSQKYEHLVCVAGITNKGEWRRIYPIPWKVFWKSSGRNFKKKSWIEYELADEKPSDHRPESRKIKPETITPLRPATFQEIDALLKARPTTLGELAAKGATVESLGVVAPRQIRDFREMSNEHYKEESEKARQLNLFGEAAVKLDIPAYKYQYVFKDDDSTTTHEMLCEDWEVGELYRNCERYRKQGTYKDESEVHRKVREKMLDVIGSKKPLYFIVGTHARWPTFMIISVVYPTKADIVALAEK